MMAPVLSPEVPGLRSGREEEAEGKGVAYQCSTASLLSAFHSRSHVAFMPLYYDMKYSSYQGLTASSSLVYRGAVYHENLSYR